MKPQRYLDQTRSFFREYTAGLNVRDIRRLFDQEAAQAYKVLARDRPDAEPEGGLKQLFHRVKVVFLGVSSKLTPARRMIFAASLLCALFGILDVDVVNVGGGQLRLGVTIFWFLLSVAGLAFLLIMELVDRVRVRDELEVARQLQRELLPQRSPEVEGYDFAHSYRTANEVGGDYYDFPRLPDGRLALLMGDASGHGIAAGLLMAIANATLKTALDVDPEPRKVAALLNSALYRTGDRRAFMTLFYGLLEPATGRMDFLCAGHPFPLLRRAGGAVVELGRGNLPLGLRRELALETHRVTLEPGDLLVLYTDGLAEAVNAPDGEAFGFGRLRGLLAEPGSSRRIHDRILMAFDRHTSQEPLHDDLTLVVVGRDPETPGRDRGGANRQPAERPLASGGDAAVLEVPEWPGRRSGGELVRHRRGRAVGRGGRRCGAGRHLLGGGRAAVGPRGSEHADRRSLREPHAIRPGRT